MCAVFAEQRDRRCLRLPQCVERAGQHHRDGAGSGQGDDAVLIGEFEVIRRQRAVLGREPRAMQVGKLVGMQLDRQSECLRGGKHPRRLRRRKRDAFAECIDGIG